MKSRKLTYVAAISSALVAMSLSMAGQEHPAGHHHYKLIDLGTSVDRRAISMASNTAARLTT